MDFILRGKKKKKTQQFLQTGQRQDLPSLRTLWGHQVEGQWREARRGQETKGCMRTPESNMEDGEIQGSGQSKIHSIFHQLLIQRYLTATTAIKKKILCTVAIKIQIINN